MLIMFFDDSFFVSYNLGEECVFRLFYCCDVGLFCEILVLIFSYYYSKVYRFCLFN